MKLFNDNNFLLQTATAERLYHDYASKLPIIDYHCHLNPEYVARDRMFENLSKIWLEGDHYKWRAMRSNGIEERYCTGDATDYEKFEKWAECVPYTMMNPLYHWTHLELKSAFGVEKLLNPSSAREIYDICTAKLQTPEFSAKGLLRHYNVEVVCTTDDPIDSLQHHITAKNDSTLATKLLPTWRPDKAMAIEKPQDYITYITRLSEVSGVAIERFQDLLDALQKRHDYFEAQGCRLSDHGIEEFYSSDYTQSEVERIFKHVMSGEVASLDDTLKFKTAMMVEFARMDWRSGWTQQFHYGAIRDNNSRMFAELGVDSGFDSIGDFTVAKNLSKFLDMLDRDDMLTKTIIYNLNPRDNELIATMIGNFQDGRYGAGKIQFGSGWWFLDQKDGMERQMGALSVLGLLSRFVGMLTDSRSFLSYPRHEYFRRTLCNFIANQIEQGLLPASELDFIGKEIVQGVCYKNAKSYFKF